MTTDNKKYEYNTQNKCECFFLNLEWKEWKLENWLPIIFQICQLLGMILHCFHSIQNRHGYDVNGVDVKVSLLSRILQQKVKQIFLLMICLT